MNVFNKVTLQSLKKNKTRTIVTIIGIILSAAMICAVTTLHAVFIITHTKMLFMSMEIGTDRLRMLTLRHMN